MPKKLPEGLNARIMAEIARHPEGIGIDPLHEALREFVSRRTLQRRLSEMTQEGRISENLLHDPEASGRLRRITVDISGTVFHPLAIPQVIEECFQQLLDTAAAITDPFEQAFFVMVHLPYLQPFEDVNKRVSRLAANISLILKNLCPLSFVDVPERAYVDGTIGVYELCRVELLRDVFVWAYERSVQRYLAIRQSMAQPDPFRLRYREALIEVIGTVVRERRMDDSAAFRTYASHRIPVEDREKFVEDRKSVV